MSKFVTEDGATISYPTPKKLIAMQQFMSYKCAMKQLYHKQQVEFNLNSAWETVWQPQFQTLRNHVKLRKQKVRKANYAEKIDAEFEPYAIVERYEDIEDTLWKLHFPAVLSTVHCATEPVQSIARPAC